MWTIIKTKKEYELATKRLEELSTNPPEENSQEGRELMLLGYLIDQYEELTFEVEYPQPIDAIKIRMEDLGLKITDLLNIFGDRGTASKVLNNQRGLSLSMIRQLADRLSLPVSLLIQPTGLSKKLGKKNKAALAMEPREIYKKRKKA
ncbi:MAG: type II toxin-antitoxin system HigA family antitoxin [Cyclobacteriaceae bacterium]|jgi:HTH-type transcriptional regulator/antitoxin HigA